MLAFRVLGIPELQRMKREGRKIVGVVAWDTRIAEIADRAGVDIVSVGDSVGVNLWGQAPEEVSLEEMMLSCARRCAAASSARSSAPTFPRTSKTLRRRCACRSAAPRW